MLSRDNVYFSLETTLHRYPTLVVLNVPRLPVVLSIPWALRDYIVLIGFTNKDSVTLCI